MESDERCRSHADALWRKKRHSDERRWRLQSMKVEVRGAEKLLFRRNSGETTMVFRYDLRQRKLDNRRGRTRSSRDRRTEAFIKGKDSEGNWVNYEAKAVGSRRMPHRREPRMAGL